MSFTRVNPVGWTDNVDLVTAAQLNQLDTNVTNSVDGRGGSYALSSPLVFTGTTTVDEVTYPSGAVPRVQTSPLVNITSGVANIAYGNVAANDVALFSLDRVPDGAVIASVDIYHDRADGSPLPDTKLRATLQKTNITTGVDTVIVAATEDPTTPVAAYEVHHSFTLTPGATETIDSTQYAYYVILNGESGSNAVTTVVYAPIVNLTITSQDKAP